MIRRAWVAWALGSKPVEHHSGEETRDALTRHWGVELGDFDLELAATVAAGFGEG